jgi:hypothetical protein
MSIGFCAGIPLQEPADTSRHGAVFLLRDTPIADVQVSLEGWTTTVKTQTKAVVTYGPSSATTFAETHTEALRAANNALDYMCMRGWCASAIRLDADECLLWWPEPIAGITLRARVIHTIRAQMNFTATVTDSSGNIVPSAAPPPTPAQHDALRFIRMSRTSEYLFDSYRNMFLALERLLSDIRPRRMRPDGRPNESERAWFTAALQQSDAIVPVAELAPAGETAPIEWIYTNIYSDQRSALSHAKPGRYLLPQSDAGRAELRHSLESLWNYVRQLVSALLGVEHSMSGFYHSGWALLMKPSFEGMSLFVSDKDLSASYSDEEVAKIIRDNMIALPAEDPVTEGPMLISRLGGVEIDEVHSLDGIHKMGAAARTAGDAFAFTSELPGPIQPGTSVKRFEMAAGLRNLNAADMPNFSA